MKKVLILGAGRSSTVLIEYLLTAAEENGWLIIVGDKVSSLAEEKLGGHPRGMAVCFDLHNEMQASEEISNVDLVISMLPADFHAEVAKHCIRHKKSLLTASYISPDIQVMHDDAVKAGIFILMEMGLDPGIDHMSAMRELALIKEDGGKLQSFRSYTGGLIAPDSDNNPWHYKFTWNPRNVVLAGQGTVKYLENRSYKYIPYHKLFTRTETIDVDGLGAFEGYGNRDSLKYLDLYDLQDIPTFIRGTLRRPPFCKAWNVLVQLGMTSDAYELEETETMSCHDFTDSFLPAGAGTAKERMAKYLSLSPDGEELKLLDWLGLFSPDCTGLVKASPAAYLQSILEKKWRLEPEDKDMIVMQHIFDYKKNGQDHTLTSSLIVKGDDQLRTAMAKTVGLPLAIAAKLILNGNIGLKGVYLPLSPLIYEPVLNELEENGIRFSVKHM